MNTVVMDGAVIGESRDGGGDGLRPGGLRRAAADARRRRAGQAVRELTDQELAWKVEGTRSYQELARRSLATMTATAPLQAVEPNRARIEVGEMLPLSVLKGSKL